MPLIERLSITVAAPTHSLSCQLPTTVAAVALSTMDTVHLTAGEGMKQVDYFCKAYFERHEGVHHGLTLRTEWGRRVVTHFGLVQIKISLRKKIKEHKESLADILKCASHDAIESKYRLCIHYIMRSQPESLEQPIKLASMAGCWQTCELI